MGKKAQVYGHDEDGFMTLIPRVQDVTGSSIHEGEDSAEYWRERCLHAEKKYDHLKKQTNIAYGLNPATTPDPDKEYDAYMEELGRMIAKEDEDLARAEAELAALEAESERLDELHEQPESSVPMPSVDDPPFSAGLGLSFGSGKDPRLYRLSDGVDLDKAPKERFVGGEIEIQPGRGFHIGLHWRKE